jgi:uncharacterized damage-inducible protein DinB
MMQRPTTDDCGEYYLRYAELVPDGDVLETLKRQGAESTALFAEIDEERSEHRYAPGKWSIKELVGHVVDTERIFAYRALCIARGDQQPLPGFEQDDYIANGNFTARSFASVTAEFQALRTSNLALLASLDPDAQNRLGTASGVSMRTSAIPWIMAGHELHHLRVLRETYGA